MKILIVALLASGLVLTEPSPYQMSTDEWAAACSDDTRQETYRICSAIFQNALMNFMILNPVSISKDLCGDAGRAFGNLEHDRPVGAQRSAAYTCLYAYGTATEACGWKRSVSEALAGAAGEKDAAEYLMEFMSASRDEAACAALTTAFFDRYHRLHGALPDGAAALSLSGEALYAAEAAARTLEQLGEAKADYDADPDNADNIIWYGRRLAYLGRYSDAISVYTAGLEKYPSDARFYRHRGHRYISMREFDRAILDYEIAASLIDGRDNAVEPDGQPNEAGIPISTTHGNIWYHLGLGYYLAGDLENALRGFQSGFEIGENDDNIVSTTYWRYIILKRMGRDDEAQAILDVITPDMNIIENHAYHRLALLYKGELDIDDMTRAGADNPSNAALEYGIAYWYAFNINQDRAESLLQSILLGSSWASFGFIAAEADVARR